jgi:hypothetical protein
MKEINEILYGILFGLIIFFILRNYVNYKLIGPDSNDIKKNIYYYHNEKYKLVPKPIIYID